MRIREAVAAGRWYTAQPDHCCEALRQMFADAAGARRPNSRVYGGLVPVRRWSDETPPSALVAAATVVDAAPDSIVIFGDARRPLGRQASVFGSGRWETPAGDLAVDARLAERMLGHTNAIVDDPYAHEEEVAIEIVLPALRQALPQVRIVPILVSDAQVAAEVGEAAARTIEAYQYRAIVLGSTWHTNRGRSRGAHEFELTGTRDELVRADVMGPAAVAAVTAARRLGARKAVRLVCEATGTAERVAAQLGADESSEAAYVFC